LSRIEKALERAAQLRGPSKDYLQPSSPHSQDPDKYGQIFSVGESIIDKSQVNKHLVCITEPNSPAAEQYRKLRAQIFKSTVNTNMNSLLVTSSHAGEGKTVTAINLSVAMAQAIDHTVLLIDADLRKPSVHTYLGLKPQFGLSDCLQSKAQLSEALIKTGVGKLVVLPAGNPPENPAELLASEKMKDLMKEVKNRYYDRYVIFDSSPLLEAADVINVGGSVDGIIFVIQALLTSSQSATKALTMIKGNPVLGTVLNNVPSFFTENTSYYHKYNQNKYLQPATTVENKLSLAGSISAWLAKIFHHL
jgi:protein-tyrosine kinase